MGHFSEGLSELPESSRAYFQRFRHVEDAWAKAKHGLHMARLVRACFSSPADQQELSSVVAECNRKMQVAVDGYHRGVQGERDPTAPLPFAFRVVSDELAVVDGTLEADKATPPPDSPPGEYDDYRAQALELVADVVRRRIDPPSP